MTTDVNARVIDFTNVKDSGAFNPKHKPAGDYRAKIAAVEDAETKDEKKPLWLFTITVENDSTAKYPYRCMFEANQLWKIRNLFVAAGIEVPKKRIKVNPAKLVGRTIGVTLDDDEYDGKLKSVITATFPAADLDDEPAPAPKKAAPKRATKAAPVADEDDVDEDVSEDDLEEMDLDEL